MRIEQTPVGEEISFPNRRLFFTQLCLLDDQTVAINQALDGDAVERAVVNILAVGAGGGSPQRSASSHGAQQTGGSGEQEKLLHNTYPFPLVMCLRCRSTPVEMKYTPIQEKVKSTGKKLPDSGDGEGKFTCFRAFLQPHRP